MPEKREVLAPSRTLTREGEGANAEAPPRTELAGARGVVTAELASAASPERSRTESGAEGRPLGAGASIGEDDPAAGDARGRDAHGPMLGPPYRARARESAEPRVPRVGACM